MLTNMKLLIKERISGEPKQKQNTESRNFKIYIYLQLPVAFPLEPTDPSVSYERNKQAPMAS